MIYDGLKIHMYSKAFFLAFCQRSERTYWNWMKANIMPPPLLEISSSKQRWFLADELTRYRAICLTAKSKRKSLGVDVMVKQKFWEAYSDLRRILQWDIQRLTLSLPLGDEMVERFERKRGKIRYEDQQAES